MVEESGDIMKKRTFLLTMTGTVLGAAAGVGAGALIVEKGKRKSEKQWKELADKHLALMLLFNQWLSIKQEGKNITDFFHREGIKSIAIYGMSYVGERLYEELKNTDVEVKYAIDKNAEGIYAEVDIVTPEDRFEAVDAIIVTPVFYYENISCMLKQKTEIRILSLEDILYEV